MEKTTNTSSVRPARADDLDSIVSVHLAAFHQGFNLSAFGPRFLRKYYDLILRFEQRVLLVAECDGHVEGFAAGFVNPKGFYTILKQNKWRLAFAAMTAIPTRPSVAIRLLHVARRGSQFMARPETQQEHSCELSSIAVRPAFAGQGLGKTLVRAFLERARGLKASAVYLTTDANHNESTNAFYRRAGFTLACSFQTPQNRLMNEFIMPLAQESE